MTETIGFGKIFAEDLARGRSTQTITLADGSVVTLHELDIDATGRPSGLTWGYGSVSDGGTVAHGMGKVPGAVIITCSEPGQFASLSGKTATTFTVALKKHDGTAGNTQTIYWVAFA